MSDIKLGDRVLVTDSDCSKGQVIDIQEAIAQVLHDGGEGYLWHSKDRLVLANPEKAKAASNAVDPVAHPAHYTTHPSGIECIQITEHMGFNLGNALKYIWRCDLKHDAIEDLKKARWYIDREITKRENK